MNTTSHPITPGSACGPAFYSGLRHVAFCWLLVMLPMGLGGGVGGVAKAADNRALQPPLSLTVFDCGLLQLDDVSSFGLTNAETPVRELFVPCYLIQHPQGKLMWDTGLPLAIAGQGPVELQPGATMVNHGLCSANWLTWTCSRPILILLRCRTCTLTMPALPMPLPRRRC